MTDKTAKELPHTDLPWQLRGRMLHGPDKGGWDIGDLIAEFSAEDEYDAAYVLDLVNRQSPIPEAQLLLLADKLAAAILAHKSGQQVEDLANEYVRSRGGKQ